MSHDLPRNASDVRRADDYLPITGEATGRERRFVAAPALMLEAHDGTHAVIVNTASGARLKVSISIYRLLARFNVPRTIRGAFGASNDDRAISRIQALVERRLLVDADQPMPTVRPKRRATPFRFCNAPPYSAAAVSVDVVVLGVPYDLGGTGNGRDGPMAIRQRSLDYTYLVNFDTRVPEGWFDAQHGEQILAGVTLADADDLHITYGETQGATFDRLLDTLDELLAAHGVPLILGGDRSVAFPVAAYFAKVHALTVIQFAGETTAAERTGEMVTIHDVGRAMVALEGIVSVATLGLRHGGDGTTLPPVTEVTVDTLRDTDRFDANRDLRMAPHVLLSVDLGVLDMSMPPTGDGLSLREVQDAIDAVGRHRRIVGLVIAGLDPGGVTGNLCAIVGCHIALHAMHAATRSRVKAL
jgi:agmatinase